MFANSDSDHIAHKLLVIWPAPASQSFFCSNANASWSRRWLIRPCGASARPSSPKHLDLAGAGFMFGGGCLHRVTAGFKGKVSGDLPAFLAVYKDLGTGGVVVMVAVPVRLLMASATSRAIRRASAAMHRDFPPRCKPE